MKKLTFIILFLSSIISSYSSFSSVTFKGGIISSGEILKTEKPNDREDLFYDFNNLDLSHLEQTMSIADAIRLENRIGIGAPYKRVKRYIGKTRKEAIRLVVQELESYQDKFKWPNWSKNYIPTQFINDGLERSKINCQEKLFRVHLEYLWSRSMLTNPVPQFEKLTLFWLDHFSVAFDEYDQTHSFLRHLQFVRKHSAGNFEQFLRESIKNPGIIIYLNNEQSTTQSPNENLAREFLELFSLGEGNYTENEIKNFAKKLPSYSINHVSQEFQLYKYKSSGQTLSGFGEKFSSADGFIDLVIDHPAFGEFIVKKFYNEFLSLNEPSSEELAILVSSFRLNNFDIVKLFETTISLKSFWDDDNRLTLVKSPIELVFGTAKTLGIKAWKKEDIGWLVNLSKQLGQDLFNPPNIAGWPVGKEWLSGQFLEKRMSLLPKYFSNIKLFKTVENFNTLLTWTDISLCRHATGNGKWETRIEYKEHIQEAKRRGLSCGVGGSTQIASSSSSSNNSLALQQANQKDQQAQTTQIIVTSENHNSENVYISELNKFYNETIKDQLAVETIVINWLPDDFETKEWADMNVGFYGVKLNGKWWDGLNVTFGTDINSKQKQQWKNFNFIRVSHGFSHPEIFSSWEESWISNWDGHYGWSSSFPRGPRIENFNAKSRDEKLLMIRLLQAMQHLLENKRASPQLMKNSYAQNWLKDRIDETLTKNWNLKNSSIPNTKIFSYTATDGGRKHRKFQCGSKRAGIDFKKIRSMNKKISISLPSDFLVIQDINLDSLLLPDINLSLDDKDFLSIISFEGYQLK